MYMETLLGSDADLISLTCDLLIAMRPLIEQHNVSLQAMGNLETLSDRIQVELVASNTVASFVPLVGVWAQTDERVEAGLLGETESARHVFANGL
jgi:hypothetical protein